MQPTIKIGITDCKKYKNYEQWFLNAPEPVEVIQLSYHKHNLEEVNRCDGIVLSGGEDVHPERVRFRRGVQPIRRADAKGPEALAERLCRVQLGRLRRRARGRSACIRNGCGRSSPSQAWSG